MTSSNAFPSIFSASKKVFTSPQKHVNCHHGPSIKKISTRNYPNMVATHLQKAIEITKLCFLLFVFHFRHIVCQKASEMCRWVILVSTRSSLVQGECFIPLSPSVSPLCCLGYISWWDVRSTEIGTFLVHMQTHTHRFAQLSLFGLCFHFYSLRTA